MGEQFLFANPLQKFKSEYLLPETIHLSLPPPTLTLPSDSGLPAAHAKQHPPLTLAQKTPPVPLSHESGPQPPEFHPTSQGHVTGGGGSGGVVKQPESIPWMLDALFLICVLRNENTLWLTDSIASKG
ncbi:hypothetical protein CEXT_258131 [Caerostris extrusa]|uniref:Uncharacterized protein n=1 Tax=Caerostris extrusa TaxID=172846 RepID=A0AAV4P775_CAEEX|nr:hypothetical protein CEXT_258131 [Caerostris extrusa]